MLAKAWNKSKKEIFENTLWSNATTGIRIHWYTSLLILLAVTVLCSTACATKYPGFIEMMDNNCIVLDEVDLQKLSAEWRKYKDFVKKCGFVKRGGSKASVYLISVWAIDCLEAKRSDTWENFPRTIIVDEQFKQIGAFPEEELYPYYHPCSLYIYYGKWQGDIPGEILIDVSNPAVSGDYYYAPLIWDKKTGKYEMKDRQDKSGPRPTMHREKKSKQ